jgi:hypothetical protein
LTWRLPFQCQSINKNHNLKPVVWHFSNFNFNFFYSQWHTLTCRTHWLLKHCWYERAKQGTKKGCKESSLGIQRFTWRQNSKHVANLGINSFAVKKNPGINCKHNFLIWGMMAVKQRNHIFYSSR